MQYFINKITQKYYYIKARFSCLKNFTRFKQEWFAYKYLQKKYPCCKPIKHINNKNNSIKQDKTIWIYWDKGLDGAPELVQQCYKSVILYKEDYDLVFLDDNNLSEYITIPEYIQNKLEKGYMPKPQYSDLIRITLLVEYGGVWLDSTCYLSNKIPDYIKNTDFFIFQTQLFDNPSPIKSSSWFIKANSQNKTLILAQTILFKYWETHTILIDYYLLHIIFFYLYSTNKEVQVEWDKIPYLNNQAPHLLQYSFPNLYSAKEWEYCLNSSFIHKLNYKFDKTILSSQQGNIAQYFLSHND